MIHLMSRKSPTLSREISRNLFGGKTRADSNFVENPMPIRSCRTFPPGKSPSLHREIENEILGSRMIFSPFFRMNNVPRHAVDVDTFLTIGSWQPEGERAQTLFSRVLCYWLHMRHCFQPFSIARNSDDCLSINARISSCKLIGSALNRRRTRSF